MNKEQQVFYDLFKDTCERLAKLREKDTAMKAEVMANLFILRQYKDQRPHMEIPPECFGALSAELRGAVCDLTLGVLMQCL